MALCALMLACEPELDGDAGATDAHVQEAGATDPDTAALDAGLLNDAMSPSLADATMDAPASESTALDSATGDSGKGDSGTGDSGGAALDARASDASPADATRGDGDAAPQDAAQAHDATPSDSAVDAGPSASATRYMETGRTCHALDAIAKDSQRANCLPELCGPAQVQLELTALPDRTFEVLSCPSKNPGDPYYDWPFVFALKAGNTQVMVIFDNKLRDLPLTLENLRANVSEGNVAYLASSTRPANAVATWLDHADDLPVEIVDYRDGVLHVKVEHDHASLSYFERREHVCELKFFPLVTLCSELYCNYEPGPTSGHEARHLEAHAIGKLPSPLCP